MATCPLCKTDLVQKVPDHKAFRCMQCRCYFIILNQAEFSRMMVMKTKLEENQKAAQAKIKEAIKTPEGVQEITPPISVLAAAANRVVDLQNALAEAISQWAALARWKLPTDPDLISESRKIEKARSVLNAKVPQSVVDALQQAVNAGQLKKLDDKPETENNQPKKGSVH